MWREKNIYFTEHDIYFTKLMFILKNINLELKSALRTKYIFYRILLYYICICTLILVFEYPNQHIYPCGTANSLSTQALPIRDAPKYQLCSFFLSF